MPICNLGDSDIQYIHEANSQCFSSYNFILYLQLNFIGVTLSPERHYIHFTSTQHIFTPIAIGTYDSPKQVKHHKAVFFSNHCSSFQQSCQQKASLRGKGTYGNGQAGLEG